MLQAYRAHEAESEVDFVTELNDNSPLAGTENAHIVHVVHLIFIRTIHESLTNCPYISLPYFHKLAIP